MNKQRAKMPNRQRAKQFAPFDAVVGLRAALKEKEKIKVPKKIISDDMAEEIDRTLKSLQKDDLITIVFYNESEENYEQITGKVTVINGNKKRITIGTTVLSFDSIYKIIYLKV